MTYDSFLRSTRPLSVRKVSYRRKLMYEVRNVSLQRAVFTRASVIEGSFNSSVEVAKLLVKLTEVNEGRVN